MRLTVDVNFDYGVPGMKKGQHHGGTQLTEKPHYAGTHHVVGNKTVPAKNYEVHHNGTLLGHVRTAVSHKSTKRVGTGSNKQVRWSHVSANPDHPPGSHSSSREEAVEKLKWVHGVRE
jgi:hypothetical protein